jgi:hypothetical protein
VPRDGGARGRNWSGHTRRSSVYTRAFLNPGRAAAISTGIAATLAAAAVAAGRRRR